MAGACGEPRPFVAARDYDLYNVYDSRRRIFEHCVRRYRVRGTDAAYAYGLARMAARLGFGGNRGNRDRGGARCGNLGSGRSAVAGGYRTGSIDTTEAAGYAVGVLTAYVGILLLMWES